MIVAKQLTRAESADGERLPEGLDISEGSARREVRLQAMAAANAPIEALRESGEIPGRR